MKNRILLFLLFTVTISNAQIADAVALEDFFKKQIQPEIDQKNIAGATISIIQDGNVKFQKGYGYADIENDVKVDGKNTIFRVASISKLFVWIAIMKLYEEGKLDLNDEITKYLPDLAIPNNYPRKITIKDLMSHSAGFEDEMINLFKKTPSEKKELGDILKKHMPIQVRPPSTYSSYSNHGTGMAAHIVENITKMDFLEYAEQEILKPLGMNQSTFHQPIPAHLASLYAKGYKKIEETLVPQEFEYVPLYPVGGASTSGGDMVKFMQLLLNQGQLGEVKIMDATTHRIMTATAHQHHPRVNPMRHGFMDFSQNRLSIYGHAGDLFYHHSIMALIPEHNLGIYFAINSETGFPGLTSKVLIDFIDEYFPEKIEKLTPPSFETLAPFKGFYVMNRYCYDDILKLGKLIGILKIEVTEDGFLKTAFGDFSYQWVQEDDLVFRHDESSETLVFERDKNGQITHALIGGMSTVALEKLEGMDTPYFHLAVFGLTLLVFLCTVIYWLFSKVLQKRKKESKRSFVSFPKSTKQLTLMSLASVFLFYIGLGILFSNQIELIYGIPSYAYLLFSIPLIIIVLTAILFYHLANIWMSSNNLAIWKKGAFSFICLCLVLCIFQWNYWNFIGFNF